MRVHFYCVVHQSMVCVMSDEPTDLRVENALLRASLFLTANVLKDYHGARHTKTDDGRLQVVVSESVHERAGTALERADRLLRDEGRGR